MLPLDASPCAPASLPGRQPEHLHAEKFNGPREARRLQWQSLWCIGLLYGHFGLGLAGLLPLWTLLLTAPILVVRWMLAIHELFHLRTEREVPLLIRAQLLLLTPLSLGYREFLISHRGHHRFMATQADPEYYHLRGGKVSGFLNALTAPEQMFLRHVARHGMDQELIVGGILRLALFGGLAGATGAAFWWYLMPVRLAFGSSYFAFFYCLHRRGPDFGVYPLPLPPWAARLFALLFGQEALLATCHHDRHHAHPRISAFHLPNLNAQEGGRKGL